MEFEAHARREAQATLDALAAQLRDSPALERLVQELSKTAREEADTAAERVRVESEQRAEAERAAARAAAQAQADAAHTQADAAQAVNAALLTNLDGARQQLQEAQEHERKMRGDAERLDQELHRAAERIRALEALAIQRAADARAAALLEEASTRAAWLEEVGAALQSLYTAANARELFEALLEHLARHFGRAALFVVGTTGLKGWEARGLGATTNISDLAIPPAIESLLARVLTDRAPIRLSGDAPVGLLNSPIAHAMALPIVAQGRVKAVAFIEEAEAPSPPVPGGYMVAEMLVAHTSRRLVSKAPAQGPEQPGTGPEPGKNPGTYARARQTERVKMQDLINVTLDGSASFLVDVSVLGAQVLSPTALHPNSVVRMTLLAGDKTLACKGRVIWSSLEQLRGTAAALCRAGLQFTEADPHLLDAFLAGRGIAKDRSGDFPGLRLLKGTA